MDADIQKQVDLQVRREMEFANKASELIRETTSSEVWPRDSGPLVSQQSPRSKAWRLRVAGKLLMLKGTGVKPFTSLSEAIVEQYTAELILQTDHGEASKNEINHVSALGDRARDVAVAAMPEETVSSRNILEHLLREIERGCLYVGLDSAQDLAEEGYDELVRSKYQRLKEGADDSIMAQQLAWSRWLVEALRSGVIHGMTDCCDEQCIPIGDWIRGG